jgi:hypothetical protein
MHIHVKLRAKTHHEAVHVSVTFCWCAYYYCCDCVTTMSPCFYVVISSFAYRLGYDVQHKGKACRWFLKCAVETVCHLRTR